MYIPNSTLSSVECYTFPGTIVMPFITPKTVSSLLWMYSLNFTMPIVMLYIFSLTVILRMVSVKGILICGFPFVLSLGGGLNRRGGAFFVRPLGDPITGQTAETGRG